MLPLTDNSTALGAATFFTVAFDVAALVVVVFFAVVFAVLLFADAAFGVALFAGDVFPTVEAAFLQEPLLWLFLQVA